MEELGALRRRREQRFFEAWGEFVQPEHVQASEENLRQLVDDLITLGPDPSEEAARRAVDACVRRFNELDDGWIQTIEREDIFEQIGQIVDLCGLDCQEDWLDERDW